MRQLKIDSLAFPAVQVPSADVNTLDDYEEGTWTPVLGGDAGASGQAYVIQKGSYTKIGRVVIATFEVKLSAKGTPTGTVIAVTGLPFVAAATLGRPGGSIGYAWGFASNVASVSCYAEAGAASIAITGAPSVGTAPLDNLPLSALGNSTYIMGCVSFFV